MIRKVLGRVAAVAIVVGMTVATPMTVARADPSDSFCAFLDDGGGAGSAASLPPNSPLNPGTAFEQVNAGAWQLCYDPDTLELTLFAHQEAWCIADNNSVARLRPCDPADHPDQRWFGPANDEATNFQVKNFDGPYLCATGGVGSLDSVVSLSDCSGYHSTWRWQSSP